jgi:hypothetical protein
VANRDFSTWSLLIPALMENHSCETPVPRNCSLNGTPHTLVSKPL